MVTAKVCAGQGTWMKRPIFSVLFSHPLEGIEVLDLSGILQSKCVVSKMRNRPDAALPGDEVLPGFPPVPMPSAQTNPTPVTDYRRVKSLMLPVEV